MPHESGFRLSAYRHPHKNGSISPFSGRCVCRLLQCRHKRQVSCRLVLDERGLKGINAKYPTAAPVFSQKMSPRKLNEAGMKLLEDIGGAAFLSENKNVLVACIDERNPKTALDVEEAALLVLYDHLDDDMFNDMKKWVYNSPSRKLMIDGVERDYIVTMNDVCFVLSLPLRDMYLELHPELL